MFQPIILQKIQKIQFFVPVIVNNSANHYSLFNLILNLFLILTVSLTFNVAKYRILFL
jgi:hypothetical protein